MSSDIIWRGAEALRPYLIPVSELVAFPENPKRSDEHISRVAKSLNEFGQVRAILTWENAEEFELPSNTIVGGHHVMLATQEDSLAWTHVAAIPAHFSSYESAKRYLALDNLLSKRSLFEEHEQKTFADLSDEEAYGKSDEFLADVSTFKRHERSTRQDPMDLIEHAAAQLKEVGFTENVVIARDGTILKGERVMQAAAVAGLDKVPVTRVDYDADDPRALKIMAMDYASGKRAMVDDRQFAQMLKNLYEELGELEGTGYDPEMVANLMMISRTASEIKDSNQAIEWIGLPEYQVAELPSKLTIQFDNEEARELYMLEHGFADNLTHQHGRTISVWWPIRESKDDPSSLRFVGKKPSDLEVSDVAS